MAELNLWQFQLKNQELETLALHQQFWLFQHWSTGSGLVVVIAGLRPRGPVGKVPAKQKNYKAKKEPFSRLCRSTMGCIDQLLGPLVQQCQVRYLSS